MKFKSIASRIIVSIIPIIAISTAIFVALSYFISRNQINQAVNDKMQASLEAANLRMQVELEKNAKIAENMARTTEILGNMNTSHSLAHPYLKEIVIEDIFSNKNTVGGGIWYEPYTISEERYHSHYVYMDAENPVYVDDYSEKGKNNFHEADWYLNGKNAKTPDIIWSGVYYDPVAKVIMITATKPMYTKNGKFIGVTTADMALTDIKSITDQMSVGETGRAFLLGTEGEYITFYKEGKNIEEKMPLDADKELAKAGEYLKTNKSGEYKFKENGIRKRIYFNTVSEVKWTLGIVIDESEIGTNTLNLLLILTSVPLIGLVLSIFVIILLARHLRKIVNKVNTFALTAAEGDFDRRIQVTEEDEFGIMGRHLNAMMAKMAALHNHSAEMLALAQAASRAKSDFLSRMSHEIRTPMNAIIGMTQIANKTDDEEKIRECLNKINNASHHLLSLINDILDMAKIEADKLELVHETFNIQAAIQNIYSVMSIKAEEKEQIFDLNIDQNLPQFVTGDELRFSQVITNLLGNAFKFTKDKGNVTLEVKVLENDNNKCLVQASVQDTGIGLTQEQITRLFLPFEQADGGTSRKFGGTGLGLAISKRISEMMGGEIRVESELEKGSTFFFTARFDIAAPEETTTFINKKIEAQQEQKQMQNFTKNHVLLAEDVDINREIVAALLEETHLGIDYAENGEEAVNMFNATPEKYDLILMDLQMPIMDGLEATRAIRASAHARAKTIPILAMTANAFKEDIEKCLEAGMNDHISKPIDFEVLINKLKEYLPVK